MRLIPYKRGICLMLLSSLLLTPVPAVADETQKGCSWSLLTKQKFRGLKKNFSLKSLFVAVTISGITAGVATPIVKQHWSKQAAQRYVFSVISGAHGTAPDAQKVFSLKDFEKHRQDVVNYYKETFEPEDWVGLIEYSAKRNPELQTMLERVPGNAVDWAMERKASIDSLIPSPNELRERTHLDKLIGEAMQTAITSMELKEETNEVVLFTVMSLGILEGLRIRADRLMEEKSISPVNHDTEREWVLSYLLRQQINNGVASSKLMEIAREDPGVAAPLAPLSIDQKPAHKALAEEILGRFGVLNDDTLLKALDQKEKEELMRRIPSKD